MKFKGTKVNWRMYKTYDEMDTPMFSVKSKEGCIAHVYNLDVCCGTQERSNANALLISKAPEILNELNETVTDLKILRNQIADALKTNHLFEGMPELIDEWIQRKQKLIKESTEL